MDDEQERDHYEERLKEVFNSFDGSGCGSLCPEELSDLCRSLHLDDATPALLDALLQNQDCQAARVDFTQFKNALILVLSNIQPPQKEQETPPKPESPEIQPKFVKGSKRYGRRSTPEFIEPISDFCEVTRANPTEAKDLEDNDDSAVPRKRERWNGHETSSEEYEAEGQMHLWNPDEPSTPRKSSVAVSSQWEEKLREACDDVAVSWDGCASHSQLLGLCEHLGLEVTGDVLQGLNSDGVMDVQEFFSTVMCQNQPPTPSASTPYRQLKRLHSTQPFDEGRRRIALPSALTSTIGMRLFSTLDDGTGFTPAEYVLDAWMDEGIENSTEILQALNFSLDGKLSLSDLTVALENELLITKNGIHQAALASFKAEIRYLLGCVDREFREKEKIRLDLEKAEKLKTQFATEVDEHHSSIEQTNSLNLRKMEQDHKEKLAAVRSELMKEMDQIQQQAVLQREELETEIEKIRADESFLRDHLSISVKENRRLEMEVLDTTEKLVEAQNQVTKLQSSLDNILKEKFGDLDPGSADFFLQEERIKQLRSGYEVQCRELQDRIDELQSELQDFHSLGRTHPQCHNPLSEELESKSPGMESDPGIGSEEVPPFSLSLEAEMVLEQLKDQHLKEMEQLRNQLESKITEFDKMMEKQQGIQEEQKAAFALQHQQEVQVLREELASSQRYMEELQSQLEQAELEQTRLKEKQVEESEELKNLLREETGALRQQLQDAQTLSADLEGQLKALKVQQAETDDGRASEIEELRKRHAVEMKEVEEKSKAVFEARLEEEKNKLQEAKDELRTRLLDGFEKEREQLQQRYEDQLQARLEESKCKFEEEQSEIEQKLTEQWQKERAQLDEQNNESLQVVLEEEMMRLEREREEKENQLRKEWEGEKAQLLEQQETALLDRILQERAQLQEQFDQREKKLKQEWEEERSQLEEDYEGMLQDRLNEERERLETEKEELDGRLEYLVAEEKARLEERHREAMQLLTAKHTEERNALSGLLKQLRDDIAQEREEIQISFSQRIKEVEERFTGDQQTVAERFQADVLRLEKQYETQLNELSESHARQKLHWEAELRKAIENAEEQRQMTEETVEQERESQSQEWTKERRELERLNEEKLEALLTKNLQLQNELDSVTSASQTREIDLSRQLNELHNRLQDNLRANEVLLAQNEKKTMETELLLNRTMEDYKLERAELLSSKSELQAKYNEMLSISEKQITERIELLTERDDLKMKIEELEGLLNQGAQDLERDRKELQGHIVVLQEMLKENLESDCPMNTEAITREMPNVTSGNLEDRSALVRSSFENFANAFNQKTCSPPIPSDSGQRNLAETDLTSEANLAIYAVDSLFNEENGGGGSPDSVSEEENRSYGSMAASENLEHDISADVEITRGDNSWLENTNVDERHNDQVVVDAEHDGYHAWDSIPDLVEDPDTHVSETAANHCGVSLDLKTREGRIDAAKQQQVEEFISSLEALEGVEIDKNATAGMSRGTLESCEEDHKPQDVPVLDSEGSSREDETHHETAVDPPAPEETGDPFAPSPEDAEHSCISTVSHECGEEAPRGAVTGWGIVTADTDDERGGCVRDQDASVLKLQALYSTAVEENVLLHEKIVLLQQKTGLLENLLAHNNEKMRTGHQFLEENYSLKFKMLLLMEHIKALEMKVLTMTELQIRYEDCMYENAQLKDQNRDLEDRVWNLESKINVFPDFQDKNISLAEELGRMRQENSKLLELFSELERQGDSLLADTESPQTPSEEDLLDRNRKLHLSGIEEDCVEFEQQNTKLRRAITELQDMSQMLCQTTQAHRSAAVRLTEENLSLQQKIVALKEEDLKEAQNELIHTLECLENEKISAQKAEENFNKQMSALRRHSQQLSDENGMLTEKTAQDTAELEKLKLQLAEQMKENERRGNFTAEEKNTLAVCVSALEAELTKALKDSARLEDRNTHLSQQISGLRDKAIKVDSMRNKLSHLVGERRGVEKETEDLRKNLVEAQERVKTMDESLMAVNHQSARLKSDLRNVQQERESLKQEVALLQKQLQSASEKNHVSEVTLHSGGLQNQTKKLHRDEASPHMEQEDTVQSKEKVRQLDATILSLKQHKHLSQTSLVRALEQENAALKQELESQKELTKGSEAGEGHTELETLQQENEMLKVQMARLSAQLLESFQAHFAGLLPPSPHRMPRGQHHAEDPDHVQDDREKKMKNMEERMKEIEMSLHNVKLMLKEKVAQLKDQRHKNGKADVLIKDLYVENGQLLKALERTEQRQKVAEKKNYLLGEKISTLNKIVRELNPSILTSPPYNFQCA